MFVDQAQIQVFAGDGGNGSESFRREKYIPQGGPDGGDGGRGGSVYLNATAGVDTLLDLLGRHHWYATRGEHGKGKKQAGKDGKDLIIRLPPGTLIYDNETGILLADLKTPGKQVLIARGGRGGKGNVHFVNSVRQAPDFAEPGGKGQTRKLRLELRLIADVGLVGMPNAGKSTLLSRVSAARPKIADYPFTTLVPQLGIAEVDAERRLVIADIPGLIEGASEGHGLGLDFLRHIERTRVIVHLIDILPIDSGGGGGDPIVAYRQIRKELEAYSPKLAAKPEILVANKMDLAGASQGLADLRDALPGKQIYAISAVSGTGLRPLLETIWQQVQKAPPSAPIVDRAPLFATRDADKGPAADYGEPVEAEDMAPVVQPRRSKGLLDMPDAEPVKVEPIADHGGVIKPRRTAAARKAGHHTIVVPKPEAPTKPVAERKAKGKGKPPKPVDADAELAAEVAAIKADDVRKGPYYPTGTRKTRKPLGKRKPRR